jgi:hypothetical protein
MGNYTEEVRLGDYNSKPLVVLWNGEVHSWNMKEKEGRGDKRGIYKEKGCD